jgi:hypothetical protein
MHTAHTIGAGASDIHMSHHRSLYCIAITLTTYRLHTAGGDTRIQHTNECNEQLRCAKTAVKVPHGAHLFLEASSGHVERFVVHVFERFVVYLRLVISSRQPLNLGLGMVIASRPFRFLDEVSAK